MSHSDSLRDRIMAALAPHRYGSASTSAKAVDYARADAVIEALDLGNPCVTQGCRMRRMARDGFRKYGENYGI